MSQTAAPHRIRAEVAFTTQPLATVPAFLDVSAYLAVSDGRKVSITRGRSDEFAQVQPSRMSMVLDNSDGRFTPGLATSPYSPNVKKGRRIRVTVRPWDYVNDRPTNPGNAVTNPGAEVNTTGWSGVNAAIARTTTAGQFRTGVAAFQFTVTAGAALSGILSGATVPVVAGRTYTFSAYLKKAVNARNGAIRVQFYKVDGTTVTGAVQVGPSVSVTTAAFTRATLTATAPADAAFATVQPGTALAADAVAAEVWWVDDVMADEGASAGAFTTTAPDILYRFDGFVDEWPVVWQGGPAAISEITVTATDRLARLARGRTLRSAIEEHILAAAPSGYWPLSDASGATSFAASDSGVASPLVATQVGAGGTLTAATATGPDTDGLSAPTFTPVDVSNGLYLYNVAALSLPPPSASAWSISCYFNTAATDGSLVGTGATGGARHRLELSSGQVVGKLTSAAGSTIGVATSPLTYNDGATHHAAMTYDGATLRLYVDGTQVATSATAGGGALGPSVYLNTADPAAGAANLVTMVLAHVAVHPTVMSAYTAGQLGALRSQATAGASESSDARVTRWAAFLGVTSASIETGVSTSLQFRDWTGQTALALLREVETAERGMLFFDGQGRLVFHARSHRYNPTIAATLAADQYGADLTFLHNDFLLANDVQITKAGGSTFRSVNAASQAEHDVYVVSETSITTSDNEAASAAQWRTNTYGTPLTRVPAVSVDLLTQPSLIATVTAVDLGSAIRLTGLPSQAPASTVDLFVEGYSEDLALDAWDVKFTTTPITPGATAWVLDSATYSVLGTTTIPAY